MLFVFLLLGFVAVVLVLGVVLVRRLWLRCRFVRFARPSFLPSGCGRLARWSSVRGVPFGWRCVAVSSLPAVRSAWWVCAVRPAVVARRSGELLWVWVWVCPPP